MEIAPSARADQQIDIKELASTGSQEQAKEHQSPKSDIPFEEAKKYKRSEIHDRYGGKERIIITKIKKFSFHWQASYYCNL